MSQIIPPDVKLDSLYLKFFKYAIIGLMTLALASIIVLLPMAAYNYFQTPVPPVPAKAPPERTISVEDLKKFLIEEEKRRQEQEKNGGTPAKQTPVESPSISLRYLEQATAVYRCSEEFRTLAQQSVNSATPAELATQNEIMRAHIERLAGDKFRGENWVSAMVTFTCSVLRSPEMAKLKMEKAVGAVFYPTINFHANIWARIEHDKFEFRQAEERRVAKEIALESARVAEAKGRAWFMLSLVGGAVLFFLAMALYLIFAKIEDNLAMIHQAIVQRTLPATSSS